MCGLALAAELGQYGDQDVRKMSAGAGLIGKRGPHKLRGSKASRKEDQRRRKRAREGGEWVTRDKRQAGDSLDLKI